MTILRSLLARFAGLNNERKWRRWAAAGGLVRDRADALTSRNLALETRVRELTAPEKNNE